MVGGEIYVSNHLRQFLAGHGPEHVIEAIGRVPPIWFGLLIMPNKAPVMGEARYADRA